MVINIKKKLGIQMPEESEEVKRRRLEREAGEKVEFSRSGIGKIIEKIQGVDPRASPSAVADRQAEAMANAEAAAIQRDTEAKNTEKPVIDTRPSYPGEVVTKELFSPSAIATEGTQPTPEQRIGVNIAQRDEEQRRQAFSDVTGSGELAAGLEGQILNPPSLAPASIFSGEFGGGGGINTPIEKTLTGLAVAGVAGVAAFLIPGVAALFTGSKIGAALAGNALSIKGIAALALGGLGVRQASSFLQGTNKIQTLKGQIDRASSLASTTLSAVTNGMSPVSAIDSLAASVDSINEAESAIKQLAIYNIDFRISKEYLELEQSIKQKRQEVLERVLAIQNIAAQGKSQANPEGLMLDLLELEKLKND